RLGVISNFYGNVAALCQEAGLDAHLEMILDSMQVGLSKPQPEIFELALNKLQLSPDRVIFVGDSYERDMIPARELGMKTVWLKGPNPRVPENAGPVAAQVSSLPELEALLP
ncbi:MAG: HAD family hydrolase, partial [Deltaproteobacteria bacterium]|nr:HAD family hydrolase [Deltaproteobacteria bacterium]